MAAYRQRCVHDADAVFLSGVTDILHPPQFDVDALIDIVKRDKVTRTMMVPSQFIGMMVSLRFELVEMQSLQMIILSLGAPLHKERPPRSN